MHAYKSYIIGVVAFISALLHFAALTIILCILNDCILGLLYGWSFDTAKFQVLHSIQYIVIPSFCIFLWINTGRTYQYVRHTTEILILLANTGILIKGGYIDTKLNTSCCFFSSWKLLVAIYALFEYVLRLPWPLVKVFLQGMIVAICFATVINHLKGFNFSKADYERDEESVLNVSRYLTVIEDLLEFYQC